MKRSHVWIKAVLLTLIALIGYGCGGGSSGLNDNQGGSTLSVAAVPTSIAADGISFSTITAVLTDNEGKPALQGTAMVFTTTLGVFANGSDRFSTVTDANGTAIAILYAGTVLGDATVQCSAGGLVTNAVVKFTAGNPGPTAIITLVVAPSSQPLYADGISYAIITATLTDKNGTPVAIGTPAVFTTNLSVFSNSRNSYSTTTVDESGTAVATLNSGLTPGTATVTCTSYNVSAFVNIEIASF